MTETLVVVYGTLKNGYGNHRLLERIGAEFVGEATVPGYTLHAVSSFPGARPRPGGTVKGEVYRVDVEAGLAALDRLEGYPNMYGRDMVQTPYGPAWMYVWGRPTNAPHLGAVWPGDACGSCGYPLPAGDELCAACAEAMREEGFFEPEPATEDGGKESPSALRRLFRAAGIALPERWT